MSAVLPSDPLITGETPNSGTPRANPATENQPPRNDPFHDQLDVNGRPMLSQTPTPVYRKPAVDASGMPLPRRVDEIDQNATRVIPIQREVTPVSKPNLPSQRPPLNQQQSRPITPPRPPTQPPRRTSPPSGARPAEKKPTECRLHCQRNHRIVIWYCIFIRSRRVCDGF